MAGFGVLDSMSYIHKAGLEGRAQGKENRLAQLSQQAYGQTGADRQSSLAQMEGTTAGAGHAAGAKFRQMDVDSASDLARKAQQFVALAEMGDEAAIQAAYPQFAAEAAKVTGYPIPQGAYDPKFLAGIQKLASAGSATGLPAGLQEFNAMSQGLSPEDQQRARRVALGLDGRASSAGGQTFEMPDENGVPTRYTFNPVTRQYERAMLGGASAQAQPASQGQGQGPINVAGGSQFASLHSSVPGLRVTSGDRTPERNAQVGGVPNSYHLKPGMAQDILPPSAEQAPAVRQWAAQNNVEVIDEGDHWHFEPKGGSVRGAAPAQGQPIVGRRKEDEAAAVRAAEERVTLGNLPQRGQIEADNAGLTTRAQEAEKLAAYIKATDPTIERERRIGENEASIERSAKMGEKRFDAMDTIGLLDVAEGLVKQSTGSGLGAARDATLGYFGKSTEGANAIASLKTIAGQLISKMPRMEGPQSDADVKLYKDMAGNLADPNTPIPQRLAAAATIRALNARYAGGQKAAPEAPQGGGWGIRLKGAN